MFDRADLNRAICRIIRPFLIPHLRVRGRTNFDMCRHACIACSFISTRNTQPPYITRKRSHETKIDSECIRILLFDEGRRFSEIDKCSRKIAIYVMYSRKWLGNFVIFIFSVRLHDVVRSVDFFSEQKGRTWQRNFLLLNHKGNKSRKLFSRN